MEDQIQTICGNCAAWTPVERPGPVVLGAPKIGLCRMFPPVPFMVMGQNGQPSQTHLRPMPPESDTCGHFVLREIVATN